MRYVGKDWRLDTSRKLSLDELIQIAAVLGEVKHERPAVEYRGDDLEERVRKLEQRFERRIKGIGSEGGDGER